MLLLVTLPCSFTGGFSAVTASPQSPAIALCYQQLSLYSYML